MAFILVIGWDSAVGAVRILLLCLFLSPFLSDWATLSSFERRAFASSYSTLFSQARLSSVGDLIFFLKRKKNNSQSE